MKKLLSAMLLVVMLLQALPFEALAAVGKAMSDEELAMAYALTGLGTGGGLVANGDSGYHMGMKPNDSWNASQLRDWLDEKLDMDLNSITDLLSQAAFTLSELKETDREKYEAYTKGKADERAQKMYLEAEQLRETLRYYHDQLTEATGVIAEYGRMMREYEGNMFDSDRVRYSACIEEAQAEIRQIRGIVSKCYTDWQAQIQRMELFLRQAPSSNDGAGGIGGLDERAVHGHRQSREQFHPHRPGQRLGLPVEPAGHGGGYGGQRCGRQDHRAVGERGRHHPADRHR